MPELISAVNSINKADILIVIGTSMQVYPAAGLIDYVHPEAAIYFIDPNPSITEKRMRNLTIIPEIASIGLEKLISDHL